VVLPPDQLQELGAQGGILAKPSEKARSHCVAVHFFNAAHLDTQVPCFHHNGDTSWPQHMIDRFCDLAGEPLLKLKAVCKHIDQPG
jgi:hypothetical protein